MSTENGSVNESVKADETPKPTPRRFRCYTKTGDKGFSSLYNGERRTKDDLVFHALGDVDELMSAVGVAAEFVRNEGLSEVFDQLATIQCRLLDVGSAVATPAPSSTAKKLERVKFDAESIPLMERWLDAMDDQLPPLHLFILPSGGLAAVHLHLARSICRRAERAVIQLNFSNQETPTEKKAGDAAETSAENFAVEPAVCQYLNRLSDYLFTAARFAALKAGRPETTYKKAR